MGFVTQSDSHSGHTRIVLRPIFDLSSLRVDTLEDPLHLTCKLSSCWNPHCSEYAVLRNPEAERLLTMQRWRIGWDVLLWRRFQGLAPLAIDCRL